MPQWKQNSQGKSALMIDGARRTGKRETQKYVAKILKKM